MRSLKSRNLGVSKSHDCHQSGKQVQDYLVLRRKLDPQQKKIAAERLFLLCRKCHICSFSLLRTWSLPIFKTHSTIINIVRGEIRQKFSETSCDHFVGKKIEVSLRGYDEIIFQIDIFLFADIGGYSISTSFPKVPKHLHLCHDARERRK